MYAYSLLTDMKKNMDFSDIEEHKQHSEQHIDKQQAAAATTTT